MYEKDFICVFCFETASSVKICLQKNNLQIKKKNHLCKNQAIVQQVGDGNCTVRVCDDKDILLHRQLSFHNIGAVV